MKYWLNYDNDCHFSIQNLPYGVFKTSDNSKPRCGVAIGYYVLDLYLVNEYNLFEKKYDWCEAFTHENLNNFMSLGINIWKLARSEIIKLLTSDDSKLLNNKEIKNILKPINDVIMCLPASIGDYTDFYSSIEHATNVGTMFRGVENALQPNWKHLPVGYHGRASSVVISGTDIIRPMGQLQIDKNDPKKGSMFSECKLLDFELEIGCFVGKGTKMGERININNADDHIFGYVLMNDWSARDIQKWEYVPLGPFTAKNFATTISPWIVTAEALKAFESETSSVVQDNPVPLEYLIDSNYCSYDINLFVSIQSNDMKDPVTICKSNFKNMYWNPRQQLVHHSVTGCPMKPGDLLGSGTISGKTPDSYGSMLELSWKGTKNIVLNNNETRKFLKNYDTIIMTGYCQGKNYKVGFGNCIGKILPSI